MITLFLPLLITTYFSDALTYIAQNVTKKSNQETDDFVDKLANIFEKENGKDTWIFDR